MFFFFLQHTPQKRGITSSSKNKKRTRKKRQRVVFLIKNVNIKPVLGKDWLPARGKEVTSVVQDEFLLYPCGAFL
jgi:hypothetical protein